MTNWTKLILTAVSVVALSAPQMVLAQQSGTDPLALYKEAGANEEQQKKISAAAKEFQDLAQGAKKRLDGIQQRMDALQMTPLPDEKAVLENQEQLNKLIGELNIARAKMMVKARAILTPEQREKVVEIIKKHRAAGAHHG